MGCGDKTYTGLSFAPLMSKDIVTPKAWLQNGFANPSDMKEFNLGWFGFKKGYRDRFLYRNMQRKMGNTISGAGTKYEIDEAKEIIYLTNIISDFDSVISSGVEFVGPADLGINYMQEQFGADWENTYVITKDGAFPVTGGGILNIPDNTKISL